jgi:hypothetical protein
MASTVRRLDVLIASPGDAAPARDAIERSIHEWNAHRSDQEGTILRPLRWEIGGVPLLGQGDGQSVINSQLVDRADVVFAVFYHRLGSATPRNISGTVEEIDRSISRGKPVHLYFSENPVPYANDPAQFEALLEFRKSIESMGLVGTFRSTSALRTQVSRALDRDVTDIHSATGPTVRPFVVFVEGSRQMANGALRL